MPEPENTPHYWDACYTMAAALLVVVAAKINTRHCQGAWRTKTAALLAVAQLHARNRHSLGAPRTSGPAPLTATAHPTLPSSSAASSREDALHGFTAPVNSSTASIHSNSLGTHNTAETGFP